MIQATISFLNPWSNSARPDQVGLGRPAGRLELNSLWGWAGRSTPVGSICVVESWDVGPPGLAFQLD